MEKNRIFHLEILELSPRYQICSSSIEPKECPEISTNVFQQCLDTLKMHNRDSLTILVVCCQERP